MQYPLGFYSTEAAAMRRSPSPAAWAVLTVFAAVLPPVRAECELPRNGTQAELCAYVRAPEVRRAQWEDFGVTRRYTLA